MRDSPVDKWGGREFAHGDRRCHPAHPLADQPGNRAVVLFSNLPLPGSPLKGVTGVGTERVASGLRELVILYADGQADSRLRLLPMKTGTVPTSTP